MSQLVKKVDIKIEREVQVNNALQLIAETYTSPERVIYEYIQNSVDSAHELRIKNRGKGRNRNKRGRHDRLRGY